MPELPEVETVKRVLSPQLCGCKILNVTVNHVDVIAYPSIEEFCLLANNALIKEVGRRGKYLLIKFVDGNMLSIHLRMTGQLFITTPNQSVKPHTHVIFSLDNGQELRFVDTRRFGRMCFLKADENDDFSGMGKLGLEPFYEELNFEYLKQKLGKRKITIKQSLLDQSVIAGIGNIYSDEILFESKISPMTVASNMRNESWERLIKAIPKILRESIKYNDVTSEEYSENEGRKYNNTQFFRVYGREGQDCKNCGATIERTRICGRSSFYCPSCQEVDMS